MDNLELGFQVWSTEIPLELKLLLKILNLSFEHLKSAPPSSKELTLFMENFDIAETLLLIARLSFRYHINPPCPWTDVSHLQSQTSYHADLQMVLAFAFFST